MLSIGRFAAVTALGVALVGVSAASASARGGFHGGGGGGFHGGGFHGGGFHGGYGRGIGFGAAGFGLGLAAASAYPYGYGYDYGYGDPGYAYGPAYAPGYAYGGPYGSQDDYVGYNEPAYGSYTQAPLTTGRSVATGGLGQYCTTPVKTCTLTNVSVIGGGCSCRVEGGRSRGRVAQ